MDRPYDMIVVGLGAMGSATTCQLARRGYRVLGLDMFELGHQQGSSHGYHRLIRRATVESPGYVTLSNRTFELWRELEQESGQEVLRVLGEVHLIDLDHAPRYHDIVGQLRDRGLLEVLDEQELVRRFPGFRMRDGMLATYEATAGFLKSEAGIAAHLDVAARYGAEIHRGEEVTGWTADGDGVCVETSQGSYSAGRLIITTGPFAEELLRDLNLPLRVERVVNGYFEPERPDWWAAEHGAPDFLLTVPEGSFYGMPAIEGVGLKIGLSGGEGREPTTARTIRREIDDSEIDFLRNVLDAYMPGAGGVEVRRITCMCTYTPDDNFVVDRHPEHEQVFLGCGFCGRGYKFAAVMGEILADLAAEGKTSHDISFLSAARFSAGVATD